MERNARTRESAKEEGRFESWGARDSPAVHASLQAMMDWMDGARLVDDAPMDGVKGKAQQQRLNASSNHETRAES